MDTIGDFLTIIRNASLVNKEKVETQSTKMRIWITKILEREGFIEGFRVVDTGKFPILKIFLRYTPDRKSVIKNIKRISKPGRRIYRKWNDLFAFQKGFGITIVSTPQGVMSASEAYKKRLGGEIICTVE